MSVFVDGYEIDAALSEVHSLNGQVTQYPVENSFKNDHFLKMPRRYVLEGVVTDSPFGAIEGRRNEFQVINGESFALPSEEALAKLENIWERAEPVVVQTTMKTYTNMVLETLDIPKSATTGKALRFTGIFVQVQIATNERATVRVSDRKASKKTSFGHKSTTKGRTLDEEAKAQGITKQQLLDQMFPHGQENISRLNGNATTPGAGGSF